jgi:hypothetical protein
MGVGFLSEIERPCVECRCHMSDECHLVSGDHFIQLRLSVSVTQLSGLIKHQVSPKCAK